METNTGNIILWIAIAVGVFFIGRKLALWYWRIDTLVALQQEQINLLRLIAGKSTTTNTETQETVQETAEPIKENKPANSSEIIIIAVLLVVILGIVFYTMHKN
jgi:hypothetical protein